MKLDTKDPRLMDFVLNELPPDEAGEIRAALDNEENADAKAEVEALENFCGKLAGALQKDVDDSVLDELSRKRIIHQAVKRTAEDSRSTWKSTIRHAGIALSAAAILLISDYFIRESRPREAARRSSPEQEAQYLALEAIGASAPIGESDGVTVSSPEETKANAIDASSNLGDMRGITNKNGPELRLERSYPQTRSNAHLAPSQANQTGERYFHTDTSGAVRVGTKSSSVPENQLRQLGYLGNSATPNTESYADITDNPYTRALDAPLSTFSIDVDTAAYSNVRRFLEGGQWPPADAVRIEELINYFDYSYAPPARGEHPFAAHVELAECPWNAEHDIARIGLKGFEMPASERPNGNYVFLVDVSGSMNQPNKLPLVKESLKTLLGQLGGRDRVAIVTYASGSAVHLPSTSCDEKDKIRAAIEELSAGGSTHGSAGIRDAYALARENFIEGGINRVILATDGDFNVGVTSHNELHELIATEAKSNIFLTALGYGMGNYKDDTLELLADKGNGNYAYIDSYREVRRALVQKLTGTIMTIAKDVKIQVEFNPAKVASYRLIGYENRLLAARDFNDDTKDAGEIGAGHAVTALYEIVPVGAAPQPGVDPLRYQTAPPPAAEDAPHGNEWFLLKLRYKQPEGDTSTLMEIPVAEEPVAIQSASADTRFAAGVAAMGLVLRDSPHKGSATLDMARQLVESSLNNDETRRELLDMIVTAKTLQR